GRASVRLFPFLWRPRRFSAAARPQGGSAAGFQPRHRAGQYAGRGGPYPPPSRPPSQRSGIISRRCRTALPSAVLGPGEIKESVMENSRAMIRTGRVMSGLVILFMLFDVSIKFLNLPVVEDTGRQLGLPAHAGPGLAVMETIILLLYVLPRTSVLGAVLFTG